ncbi:MAG: immunoglobulin domain-containing protein [Phycisphaeraceae bacterium]|nr:immunoglobulin domain-containing protein [Phycisphaeraceae bacterium]
MLSRLIAGAVAAVAVAAAANAQCNGRWIPGGSLGGGWGASNSYGGSYVSHAAGWDPDGPGPLPTNAVFAGFFNGIGKTAAVNIAMWDGQRFLPMGTGIGSVTSPEPFAPVRSMVEFNGKVIVLGYFSAAGGVPSQGCAIWDGAWHRFTPPPGFTGELGSPAMVLRVEGERLYAGGSLGFFRWEGDQWVSLADPLPGASVYGIAIYQGQPILAGVFQTIGANQYNNIVRWNPGGRWEPVGDGVRQVDYMQGLAGVYSLAVYEGDLIVIGNFSHAGPIVASNAARWNGQQWTAMSTSTRGSALAIYQGNLYRAGGSPYHSYSCHMDITVSMVQRWEGSWVTVASDTPGGVSLGLVGDKLVAVGGFSGLGGVPSRHMASFDGQSWSDFAEGITYPVLSFYSVDGMTYAGSAPPCSTAYRGNVPNAPLRWNGVSFVPIGTPALGCSSSCYGASSIYAMVAHGGELFAGGDFRENVAHWDGSEWRATSFFPAGYQRVNALASFQGSIYAGGSLSGPIDGRLRRWDGTQWQGIGISSVYEVDALLEFRGELIVGGTFGVLAWTGSEWHPLAGTISGRVRALIEYNGDLVACGSFGSTSGAALNSIARWDGESWHPLGNGLTSTSYCSALAATILRGELVVGGIFTKAGEVAVESLAGWNGSRWRAVGNGIYHSSYVYALAADRDELLVATDYISSGSTTARYFARWTETNIPWIAVQPVGVPHACPNSSAVLTVSPASGYPGLTYRWSRNGQPLVDGLTQSGSLVAGSATATLRVSNLSAADSASYTCHVQNTCGSAVSAAAVVTVCMADTDCNGAIEPTDIAAFIQVWLASLHAGTLAGDFDRNGTVEPADIFGFISAWLQGVQTGC